MNQQNKDWTHKNVDGDIDIKFTWRLAISIAFFIFSVVLFFFIFAMGIVKIMQVIGLDK